MVDYRISQNPKKPRPAGIKSFWIPKLQTKKLNQKTFIIVLVIASVIIIAGVVFAAIKLTSQKTVPKSPTPDLSGTTKPEVRSKPTVHAVPAAAFEALKSAVSNNNASLLNAYYAAKVRVVIVGFNINESVDGSLAAGLVNSGLGAAQNPWNFNVPANELAGWQNGPYGQYFSGDYAVGISANGDVISVGFDDSGQIDSVFIAPSSILDNPSTDPGSGNTTNPGQSIPTGSAAQD